MFECPHNGYLKHQFTYVLKMTTFSLKLVDRVTEKYIHVPLWFIQNLLT